LQIHVKSLTGKTTKVCVSPFACVLDIKEKLQEIEGINIDEIRLIFAGKQLETNRLLSDYNIADESIIHAVLRLRGGGGGPFRTKRAISQRMDRHEPPRGLLPGSELQAASFSGDSQTVQLLPEKGADVNAESGFSQGEEKPKRSRRDDTISSERPSKRPRYCNCSCPDFVGRIGCISSNIGSTGPKSDDPWGRCM
jgi:ubiquitin-large subunit ribosomal protein L40e